MKRVHGVSIALLVLGVLLSACHPQTSEPIRIATAPWPGYASLNLAESLGYVGTDRMRLVHMTSASQSMHALRNRTVDAATLTLDEVLLLLSEGADLHVVLVMDVSHGADTVIVRPDIADLSQLRGRRIGVETSATGAVMFSALLGAAGLQDGDVQAVDLTADQHVRAFLAGEVDAVVTYEPSRTRLLEHGAREIFDSTRIPGQIVDVLAVHASALERHGASLQAVLAAHFRALTFLSDHPQETATHLAPYQGLQAQQVLPQFDLMRLPDIAENHAQLEGSPSALATRARSLATFMRTKGLLHARVEVSQLTDPRFLPRPPS